MMSLDGFVAGPNGEIDWFANEGFLKNTEFGQYARNLIGSVGAILLGRRTYEEFLGYWPGATNDDPVITERMNNLPKIVFSKSLEKVSWGKFNTVRLVSEDAASEVGRLKTEAGKDLVIYGSATLVSSLLNAGLIDELQIFLHPVVLGWGKPEFTDVTRRHRLELLKATPFKSGAVALYYRPVK
jgi:dihydrofolate reductase